MTKTTARLQTCPPGGRRRLHPLTPIARNASLATSRLVLATACSLLAATPGCHLRESNAFKASCGDDCYTTIATQVEYPEVDAVLGRDRRRLGRGRAADAHQHGRTAVLGPDAGGGGADRAGPVAGDSRPGRRRAAHAGRRSKRTGIPAVVETDPRFGIDAALSAFDAQLSASVFGEKNDRALNNEFFGGGTRLLDQDLIVAQTQIAKKAATGSQFAFRHYTDYDSNNAPGNIFPSAWNTNFETEVRQPLLQGAGIDVQSHRRRRATCPGCTTAC